LLRRPGQKSLGRVGHRQFFANENNKGARPACLFGGAGARGGRIEGDGVKFHIKSHVRLMKRIDAFRVRYPELRAQYPGHADRSNSAAKTPCSTPKSRP
jgi:hypothetical protein